MSAIRRMLAAIVVAGATVGAMMFGALPANAAEPSNLITISGDFFVVDDDSTIFGASFSTASGQFNQTQGVGPTHNSDLGTPIQSPCAGSEVHGEMQVEVIRGNVANQVFVRLNGRLFEGSSCFSSDIDGSFGLFSFDVPANTSRSGSFKIKNTSEGTLDSVSVNYTIKNQVVS